MKRDAQESDLLYNKETAMLQTPEASLASVVQRTNVQQAFNRTLRCKDAPGIDGMTAADLRQHVKKHWPALRAQLTAGTYRPQPVQRIELPQPDGTIRLLGNPTMLDRFIQHTIAQVIKTKWEAHGDRFQPQDSEHQIVRRLHRKINRRDSWTTSPEVEELLNQVSHAQLLERLSRHVTDPALLCLIDHYLEVGSQILGTQKQRNAEQEGKGIQQCGPLSAILATVALEELDQELTKRRDHTDDSNLFLKSQRAAKQVIARITNRTREWPFPTRAPEQEEAAHAAEPEPQTESANGRIITLRPPTRWHDPLQLIETQAPSQTGRTILWTLSILVLAMIIWAGFGQLDIIAPAEGKLAPQTLIKIVQPAETGVVKQLLVDEGDNVKAGQVIARLDTTIASADKTGIASDLAAQQLQVRRIEAELSGQPMQSQLGDDPLQFAQVRSQYAAHRQAYIDSLEQEKAQLTKAKHDLNSAEQVRSKLEQTIPTYQRAAEAYAKLEKQGFFGGLASAEKQRDAIEKIKDLDAQRAAVAALTSTIAAEQQKLSQLTSTYRSDLQKELADIRARIAQLQPNLDKTLYREGLMELRAPQDGIIKDVATTTIGAVVQPGTVVMTLVPKGEHLFADVSIKNEDVGFVRVGQTVQIKLAAYPFQQYGMLTGKVIHVSADATEANNPSAGNNASGTADNNSPTTIATYKARVQLDNQELKDPQGNKQPLTPGMQIVAEINQGTRTVLEYLLSPVQKAVQDTEQEK